MARILFTVADPSHWDILVVVAARLEGSGATLEALYRGVLPPHKRVALAARNAGVDLPTLVWRRRIDPHAFCVGTFDDLDHLRAVAPGHFAAVPASPVPLMVFDRPGPECLASAFAESRESDLGKCVRTDTPDSVPELAERLAGTSFLTTGLIGHAPGAEAADPETVVVTHAWDLPSGRNATRESLAGATRELEALIAPLVRAKQRVEIRPAHPRFDSDGGQALAKMITWLSETSKGASELVRSAPLAGWDTLANARAVVTLTLDDLLHALAGGATSAWWAPFAHTGKPVTASPRLAAAEIADEYAWARWVRSNGWNRPPEGVTHLGRVLSGSNGSRAVARVAQGLLATVTETSG